MKLDTTSEKLLDLLERARRGGVHLQAIEGKLRYKVTINSVDPALLKELANNRDAVIAFLEKACTPVEPTLPSRTGPDPLSASQLQIWLLEQQGDLGATYHLPLLLRFREAIDLHLASIVLGEIVVRHASLRTVFATVDGMPIAVTLPETPTIVIEKVDTLDGLRSVAQRPFDLVAGPLFRAAITPAEEGCEVLLCAHHIIADGQSMAILAKEFLDGLAGRELKPLPEWRFADFARWQLSAEDESAELLEPLTSLFDEQEPLFPLPIDRPRPARVDYRGGRVPLNVEEAEEVARLAAQLNVSPLDVVLTAWATALTRAAGEHHLVLGMVESGRTFPTLERIVGNFAILLPLPLSFDTEENFAERVQRTARVRRKMRPVMQVPFLRMVQEFAKGKRGNFNPLVQHVVTANDFAGSIELHTGVEIATLPLGVARFDTLLSFRRQGKGIEGELEYSSTLYDETSMKRLCDRFVGDLVSGSVFPDRKADILDRQVMKSITSDSSGDINPCKPASPWPDVLLATARTDPTRIAIQAGQEQVDYGMLARQANSIAAALRRRGVKPGDSIGVQVKRGLLLPAALLGAWEAGAVYVPLDPAIPLARLREMIHSAQVSFVLTDDSTLSERLSCPTLALSSAIATAPMGYTAPLDAETIAYIMHTSGSTGKPKPIAVPHSAISNFVGWCVATFSREELAEVLAITGIGFDISLFELLVPLAAGTKIRMDLGQILRLEEAIPETVTLLNTVPSIAAALIDAHPLPAGLRTVNLAGEPLPPVLVEQIHTLRPGLRVNNLYGPTEATIFATAANVASGQRVAIGDGIAGVRISLLDERLQPVAEGDPGEIAIEGALLATGYLGDPARTALAFIPNPDGPPGSRRYLSGDRARRMGKNLLFLGRRDRQVKVNGVRIELGDIEAVLITLPDVVEAAALVVPTSRNSAKRLVALVVVNDVAGWEPAAMRTMLADRLPAYMLPRLFPVETLPRHSNGKLDHALMSEIVAKAASGSDRESGPRGEIEMVVAQEWAKLLNTDIPSRTDHFFGRGGDSLTALRLVHALQERLSVDLSSTLIFRLPVLADLAAAVSEARHLGSPEDLLIHEIAAMSDAEVAAKLRALEGKDGEYDC
jgi:amino acid adenylation domain-containing protein